MARGIGVKNHMAETFWTYSGTLYSNPSVAKLCLEHQDRRGLDVNLLLFCIFTGEELGVRLSAPMLRRLRRALCPWRILVVTPIRRIRRVARDLVGDGTLYRALKRLELDAERGAQSRLIACFQALSADCEPPGPDLAAANLHLYAGASVSRAFAGLRWPAGC